MHDSLFLFVSAFCAEIMGTIAGFGSSSIFLPLANQVLDFRNALVLVALYHIFGNASRLVLFYRHINRRILVLFGIPSIIATIIGASLVSVINPNILKVLLGIILALFALYSLIGRTWVVKVKPLFGIIGGGLSGFTAGLIGTGGVLRGAFMTLFHLPKEQYIATIASVALVVDFTRIPLYFGNGFLDRTYLWIIPILFLIAFIGSWAGRMVVKKISAEVFRRIILVSIIIFSLMLAYQGWTGV